MSEVTSETIQASTCIVPAREMSEKLDPFHQLVQDLSDALGPCSGLDSDEIDPSHIVELMRKYDSKTSEWQKYALADYTRPYTRNLVDKGNGKSNLVRLLL